MEIVRFKGGRKEVYMIDSILKFIADKFKEISQKYQRKDITSQIPIDGLTTTETNYEVTKTGDRVDMTGFLMLGGQLAAGVYVNAFNVPQDLRANKYTAFSVYSRKSCSISIQANGQGYLINDGTQALSPGDTIVFSGSWTIGGGQLVNSLLSFLERRWRYAYEG